jgi:hypothetical protein
MWSGWIATKADPFACHAIAPPIPIWKGNSYLTAADVPNIHSAIKSLAWFSAWAGEAASCGVV